MRNKNFLLSTLIFALALSAGCGGGGSSDGGGTGADSASYSFLGASAALIEKVSIYTGYNDPEIYAELFTNMSSTRTHIVIEDNLSGGYPYDRKLEITVPGNSTGPSTDAYMVYTSMTGTSYDSISSNVNITQYDSSVGGHIAGTFDAIMCDWNHISYPGPTCTAATQNITGTFYVTKYSY
jgi:hypothetical protein